MQNESAPCQTASVCAPAHQPQVDRIAIADDRHTLPSGLRYKPQVPFSRTACTLAPKLEGASTSCNCTLCIARLPSYAPQKGLEFKFKGKVIDAHAMRGTTRVRKLSASASSRMNQKKAKGGPQDYPDTLEIIKSAEFRKEYDSAALN